MTASLDWLVARLLVASHTKLPARARDTEASTRWAEWATT